MRTITLSFLVIAAFLYGCTGNPDVEYDGGIGDSGPEINNGDGILKPLAGAESKYYRFEKEHFESSLKEGKIIFLDFHASWCPTCLKEKPNILAAFDELSNMDIVGYQVHYNDGQTTEDDKEMAKKYGITYQHTKVVIGKDGKVALKSLEVFSKEKIINEINTAIMG